MIFLGPGSHALQGFPVGITFETRPPEPPVRWFVCSESPNEQAVCLSPDPDQEAIAGAVTFQIVENVRTPPCSDQESAELLDPPVGPSVDDFVAAIADLEGYEATPAEDISVSGFSGKEFMLTAVSHGCGATWSTADRVTGMGAGEVTCCASSMSRRAGGDRRAYHPDTTADADLAALDQVIDSVEIQP